MSKPDFLAALDRGVLILDGAMGTSVHALDLALTDYQGLENCTEVLNFTRPDAVERIHRDFLEVGCDAVETNTFGGMKHVLAEFELEPRCYELNVTAAQIARRACDAYSTAERPRFVVGSIGPGTKLVSLRQVDYDFLLDSYAEQIRGLVDGGVDALLIETCQDILQTKIAIHAARMSFERIGRKLPLMCQVTMETTGTMLVGTDMAAAVTAIEAFPEVDVIGLNCATGPQEMSEHIRYLARSCTRRLSVLPNAGLPVVVNGQAHFPLAPAELARWLREFVATDGVNIVGGCCGTTAAHLAEVVRALRPAGAPPVKAAPRNPAPEPSVSSLYQSVTSRQDNSVLMVGERCNTNGSRAFKRMLAEGDLDGLVQIGIEQVKEEGAHVLDVCVDYVGREGAPDMRRVIDRIAREVTAPLMLDSTQLDVLEAGLKLAGGKCIVNSVNLEDGEEKLDRICRLCRQYGAAVVALTIDEHPTEAMAKTADRKLSIAQRLHGLLVNRHGLRSEDIFFDVLTFPITTGSEADRRLGLETLDGIEAVMKALPNCQSILGLSNISFGLQPAARVVLNSAFLHEARQRGLTAAIVHAAKILPRNQIGEERWNAALDLIYDRREAGDPLERFIGLFSEGEALATKVQIADLPIEDRLRRRIVDGARPGIERDLDEALQRYAPLEIINTFLLDGMKTVGELFGSGAMQLPFVLKSAETMKAAVAHLEPKMERREGSSRGRIVLATVRGDVHDIGKNLVDIILSNNGYTVLNLGIKQPVNNVIAALREHGADVIGLSGLLVKSTIVMRDDLLVLNEHEIRTPVILGGAALTRRYVEDDLRPQYQGALYYAKDAFEGLRLMEHIVGGGTPETFARGAGTSETAAAEATLATAGGSPAASAAAAIGAGGRPSRAASAVSEGAAARPAARATGRTANLAVELEQRYGLAEVGDTEESDTTASDLAPPVGGSVPRRSAVGADHPVPQPPFWGARVMERIPVRAALGYLNEVMLFQVQWAFRKRGRSREEFRRYVDSEVRPILRELVARCEREEILRPAAVYGYWPCNSDGDDLIVWEPPADNGGPRREAARFRFPRQRHAPHLCLSDFFRPLDRGETDVVALQLVTSGRQVSETAREWFAKNEYQQYLFLHGLGVELAEALAEYVHKQIRAELGVGEHDAREIPRLFQQGYRGSRYSFGYPACPNLEDQTRLMALLGGERIGVTLSDEYQLDPEQSTSAIVTVHPEARYFNVR
ncbi:MAG: homocysteine S-methyltransferase family protein [Planctomycetia bacterium]|nr:MAG: homocysteine S-methyltransferase family protein [Planctomycetia bacterium]